MPRLYQAGRTTQNLRGSTKMAKEDFTRTVESVLGNETIAAYARTILNSPNATIEPKRDLSLDDPQLARFLAPMRRDGKGIIEAGVIGEGGMGIVHRAEQKALGREVAVKTVRADRLEPTAIRKLLQEAYITGRLEHPNVVPVHDIYLDESGTPRIVMKRIEGVSWEQIMRDRAQIARRFGVDDPLEWNLQTLMEVCNVVAFAHSRGILHRDLKPENVMVGDYGEVYVLDWGLAVTMQEDPAGMLPHVSEATELAGTPCYMAPEMLTPETKRLGPHTDVYLLGAILYEIVSGEPPHGGETFPELVASIVRSEPVFAESTPEELRAICRRAMDADPFGRFETATQLRIALAGFLRHQGSRRLSTSAAARHAELESRLGDTTAQLTAAAQRDLDGLFQECRFGYQAALEAWPDNEVAARGMREVTVRMAEVQLARGQPRVAASVVGGLVDPPPELLQRIEAAVVAEEKNREALERLHQQLDPQIGQRTRTTLALFLGSLWTLAPLLSPFVRWADPEGRTSLLLTPTIFFVLGALLFLWARESMTKTAVNRFLTTSVGLVLGTEILFTIGAYELGLSVERTHALVFMLWFMAASTVALVAEIRLLPAAISYGVGFLVTVKHPEWRFWVTGLCNLILTLVIVVLWVPAAMEKSHKEALEGEGRPRRWWR